MDDSLVLCVGLVCIDNFFVVDTYPKEDTDQPASQAFKAPGGNAANNCTVLAQFLPNVTFLGTLPKPTYGNQYDFVINEFRNNGVKVCENCPVRHGSEWPGKYLTRMYSGATLVAEKLGGAVQFYTFLVTKSKF